MSEKQEVHFDVEDRLKQVEKELGEMQDEFQNFIYIISHDLRGPLRHASGFGEMLLSMNDDILDDKSKKFLKIIIDSAEAGKRSIDSIQNYASIILKDKVVEGDINTNNVIDGLEQAFSDLISQKKANVQYSELPSIRGDKAQITQLFECLLHNSLLYQIDEEPVSISVECQEETQAWHFSIADNGIGLSNTQLEFVFGLFKRAVVDTDYRGEGMGLAIAKQIVKRHDGRIWFTPDLSKGAKVNFTISKHP